MSGVVEGNTPTTELGREALSVVADVATRYLNLDIVRVQEACETERTRKLAEWLALRTQTVVELNVPRHTAIEEATTAFELYKPSKVTLMIEEVRDYYGVENDGTVRRAAQTTAPNRQSREAIVTTFTRWLTRKLGQLWIIDPVTGRAMTSLKLSTIHELAHASGDYPPRVAFNAVRGYIAVQAIGRLMGEIIDGLA